MDSETTEKTHPAPAETTTIAFPTISGLPQDVIDEILNHLSTGKKIELQTLPPILRFDIEIMGCTVQTTPFPYYPLHMETRGGLARDIPYTGEESRPLREGAPILVTRMAFRRSRKVFRLHPVVYERDAGLLERRGRITTVSPDSLARKFVTICNIFDCRDVHYFGSANPGRHRAIAQLGRFEVDGFPCGARRG